MTPAELASALLTYTKTLFPTDLPARSYVSHGEPSWDCGDQLTVHLDGLPIEQVTKCSTRNRFPFVITLLRCVTSLGPDAEIPTDEVLDEEALGLLADAWVLRNGIAVGRANGLLFGTVDSGCDTVSLGDITTLGPEGGLAGWSIAVTLTP